MSTRVILGTLPDNSMGLLVSRPGHDAEDPNLPANGTAFDSRWASSARVVASGAVNVPNSGTSTVMYGESLPYVPVVYTMWRAQLADSWYPNPYREGFIYDVSDNNNTINARLNPGFEDASLEIRNDRLVVRGTDNRNRMSYVVLRR